jgi:hypothetical protein
MCVSLDRVAIKRPPTSVYHYPMIWAAEGALLTLCSLALCPPAVTTLHRSLRPRIRPALSFQLTMANFQLILDALDKYAEETGINLKENPFADKVQGCDSPVSVLSLLQENVKVFKEYRDQNRKFIDCLSPVVQFVHTFSGILGEAAGLVSSEQPFRSLFFFTLSLPGSIPTCKTDLRRHQRPLYRACSLSTNHASLMFIHIRRLKESARAMTLSLNSSNPLEASSNASKYIPRSL